MRGALAPSRFANEPYGIIPAYAGSTFCRRILFFGTRDHPRVCGEHAKKRILDEAITGSSPRMRGAPRNTDRRGFRQGIIPAYAGSTGPQRGLRFDDGDHPRVCGEHLVLDTRDLRTSGSSPRMRGALPTISCICVVIGIIPAYAGSTANTQSELP